MPVTVMACAAAQAQG